MAEMKQKGIRQRLILVSIIMDLAHMGGVDEFTKYLQSCTDAERKEMAEALDCWSHTPVGVMFNRPNF